MSDAIRQLQRVTTVPAAVSVHMLRLAERGYISFEFPDYYIGGPHFGGPVPVTVVLQPKYIPADLDQPERLVVEALFGPTLDRRTVTLSAHMLNNLEKQLYELAKEELRQILFIEPSSLIPRILLAAVASLAVCALAITLWADSEVVGIGLMLVNVFILVMIAKEPRGWRVSRLGASVIRHYSPKPEYRNLSEAVRRDYVNPKWIGLQNPHAPTWFSSKRLWSGSADQNAHAVSLLVRSIDVAASKPPSPRSAAYGQH